MNTRKGKIARLPEAVREQLNRRLLDAAPGGPLLAWLNALPEVQTVLQEQFAGHPLTKQNLSEWRTGGFADWQLRREILADSDDMKAVNDQIDQPDSICLVDCLATALAGRYASLLAHWDGEVTAGLTQKLRTLHNFCRDITALRLSHHSDARVTMAQEKHAAQLQKARPVPPARHEPRTRDFDTAWNESMTGNPAPEPAPKLSDPAGAGTACPLPAAPIPSPAQLVPPGPVVGDESHQVAPSRTCEPPVITATAPSPILHSSFCPLPSPEDPVPAADPNSGDIYANEPIRIPKSLRKPVESNRDPDPKSYPSYWYYQKTCGPNKSKPVPPPKVAYDKHGFGPFYVNPL